MTLQVVGLPGNGIGGGKPIQSSKIKTVVAAETAWRPCQPGSFRATLECEYTMVTKEKRKITGGAELKKGRGSWEAESVRRDAQSLRGFNRLHFQLSCRSEFTSSL